MLQTKQQKAVLKEVLQNEVRPHVVALKEVVKESNKLLKQISEKEYPEQIATDLKPLIDGIKTLTEEVKKKEEYAYEIKIDADLKRKLTGKQGLRGERGLRGLQGKSGKQGVTGERGARGEQGEKGLTGERGEKGKDGNTITAEQVRDKLETLKGKSRLKMSAIKGLEDFLKKLEASVTKSFNGFAGGGNDSGGGTGGAVNSVFGRGGDVTAQNGDYNTNQVTEGLNLYFTVERVIATALTGFAVAGTRTAIIAGDTVLSAFGKIQKYLNDLSPIAFTGSASDLSGSKTSAFISDFASAVASLITGKSDVGHTHVSSNVTDFNEAVEDIIGAKVKAGSGISVAYNDTTGETTVTNTGGASSSKGGVSFGLARSSGLVVGDKFRTVIPYNANITGWVVATIDGSSQTITLDVKRATYINVPTFTAIDGTEPILLAGAGKNSNLAVTTWDATFSEGDHVEVSVLTVTGTVTGVYGIINVTKTS